MVVVLWLAVACCRQTVSVWKPRLTITGDNCQGNRCAVTGGITVQSGGVTSSQGITVTSGGLQSDAGISITAGGLSVTGGVTIGGGGALLSTGGLTVTNTGLVVTAGGMTVLDDGLVVSAGGLSVSGGGIVVSNGDVSVSGTAYFATSPVISSDRRLKTNITDIDDALGIVQALRGVKYNWIGADTVPEESSLGRSPSEAQDLRRYLEGLNLTPRHVGLLAQDVQNVLPEQ